MIYQILTISVIIIEGILILISFKYLKNIRVTSEKCSKISKDFVTVYREAKDDGTKLFKELKDLYNLTNNKEQHMLNTVFYLEEIEMRIKMILEKLSKGSNI